MGYKVKHEGEDIELDDDVTVDDLDSHPEPGNALDMGDPEIVQLLVEAEADDSAECGEEVDCDD